MNTVFLSKTLPMNDKHNVFENGYYGYGASSSIMHNARLRLITQFMFITF